MQRQTSLLNKKGNIMAISGAALVFSFVSIIYIFIALFIYGAANDYLLYDLQNITETLEEGNVITTGTSARTQTYGDQYTNFDFNLDVLWLICYIIFVSSSIVLAYRTRKTGYFNAFGYLFFILMAVLFLLTIFSSVTSWFNEDVLEKVFPNAVIVVPMFYFYLTNIGIITAIHLVTCLVVNLVDFDFTNVFKRRKQEVSSLDDEERL